MTFKRIFILVAVIFGLIVSICWIQFRLMQKNYRVTSVYYHNEGRRMASQFISRVWSKSFEKLNGAVVSVADKQQLVHAVISMEKLYKVVYTDNTVGYYQKGKKIPPGEIFAGSIVNEVKITDSVREKIVRDIADSLLVRLEDQYGMPWENAFRDLAGNFFPSEKIFCKLGIQYLAYESKEDEYLLVAPSAVTGYTVFSANTDKQTPFDSVSNNIQGVNFHMHLQLKIYWPANERFFIKENAVILSLSATICLLLVLASIWTTILLTRQKKLDEEKDHFINTITHEVKTPIATIAIAGNSLQKAEVNQEPEEVLYLAGIINKQAIRLRYFFDAVLQASFREQTDSGNMESDLHEALQYNLALMALNYPEITDTHIQTFLEAANRKIKINPEDLNTLISNLLDNAWKYRRHGTLEVTVRTFDVGKGATMEICDNGKGILTADMPFIFKKFYRGAKGNVYETAGLGLGLYHVKQITEKYRFHLEVSSRSGNGTCIHIQF